MTAIAAIHLRDGRPVTPTELDPLARGLAHRCAVLRPKMLGETALLHGPVDPGPCHGTSAQPLGSPNEDIWIALDGHIDNREQLWREVACLSGSARGPAGDAALLLHAYRTWGDGCMEHLLGDFAFALWDRRTHRLLCARDPIGIKPLCYHAGPSRVVVASEPGAVAACLQRALQPNEAAVGEYLAVQICSAEQTLLADVMRLPPGHALWVQGPRLRRWRYGKPPAETNLRYRTSADCAAHLREVLTEAVRVRCTSGSPVGVLLSGGLDSASIVGIAASQLRTGALPCPAIETFSMVCPGDPSDESAFIQETLQRWHTPHQQAEPLRPHPELFGQTAARHRDLPDYPSSVASDPLRQLARERGCSVVLTGDGGDEWLNGNAALYPTLLRSLSLPRLWRELQRGPTGVGLALRQSLPWLLPPRWASAAHDLWHQTGSRSPVPWITDHFARRIALGDRLRPTYQQRHYASPTKNTLYSCLTDGGWHHGNELDERAAATAHLERRCPFNDQRLIELVFALPDRFLLRRDGVTKPLLREAMAGLIPESIRQRPDKTVFSQLFRNSLRGLAAAGVFETPQVVARGWIDAGALAQMTHRLGHGGNHGLELWGLWMIAGIELWLAALG